MRVLISIIAAIASILLFAEEQCVDIAAITETHLLDENRLKAEYAKCLDKVKKPSQDITVPIESHPDGSVKVDVSALKAQFFDKEGFVWCSDVTVREYNLDGSVRMELKAKNCLLDRTSRSGWLDGPAYATYGKTKIGGCGIYFSFADEFVKISSKVIVESSDIKFEGVEL